MIVVDSTELSEGSNLPPIDDVVESQILESVTGADIMVSPVIAPITTEKLIIHHVRSGAILIQRKSGRDFVTSITNEGINTALARMIACGAKQYQRCIMTTGFYLPDSDDGKTMIGRLKSHKGGSAYIHWTRPEPEIDYKAYATIRRRIAMRGGWLLQLSCNSEIPGELKRMEADVLYLANRPVKELFPKLDYPPDPPEADDPLQIPREVTDCRRIIAAFPGIGPKKTQALWEAAMEYNRVERFPKDLGFTREHWEPKLLQLFTWMSCEDPKKYGIPNVKGWGKGLRKRCRDLFPLYEGQDLWVIGSPLGEEDGTE